MGLKKYDESIKEQEEIEKDAALEEAQKEATELLESEEKNYEITLSDEEVCNAVNGARANYQSVFKKQKLINTIVTICLLVVIVGGFVMIMFSKQMGNVGTYIGLVLIIAAMIGTFVLSKFLKKKLNAAATTYIHELYSLTNDYIYEGENFKNLNYLNSEQMPSEVFLSCHFYKNIKNTRSRNYCKIMYKGKQLQSADLAANVLVKNKTSPMFLGKFYDYECNYKKDKVIIFQLKGGELSRPLDDIDDLKLVDGTKKYAVYTNDEEYSKVLNQHVLQLLQGFRIDETLIDVILCIKEGKVSIGIDYSDEFMNIPVESTFTINGTKRAKNDLLKVLKIFDLINSSK